MQPTTTAPPGSAGRVCTGNKGTGFQETATRKNRVGKDEQSIEEASFLGWAHERVTAYRHARDQRPEQHLACSVDRLPLEETRMWTVGSSFCR